MPSDPAIPLLRTNPKEIIRDAKKGPKMALMLALNWKESKSLIMG
jgi:hypothetical protein